MRRTTNECAVTIRERNPFISRGHRHAHKRALYAAGFMSPVVSSSLGTAIATFDDGCLWASEFINPLLVEGPSEWGKLASKRGDGCETPHDRMIGIGIGIALPIATSGG
jgi:hypothetical protein